MLFINHHQDMVTIMTMDMVIVMAIVMDIGTDIHMVLLMGKLMTN